MMLRLLTLGLCLSLAADTWAQESEPPARWPMPAEDALLPARQQIRTELQAEYAAATTIQGKAALFQRLLERGLTSRNDAPAQFALLAEARNVAVDAAQPEYAMWAIDELASRFDLDGVEWRWTALQELEPKVKSTVTIGALIDALQRLSDEAEAAERADLALDAVTLALTTATRSKSLPLANHLRERQLELQPVAKEFAELRAAEQTLRDAPDERNACRTVGVYLCVAKNEWEEGLQLLVKGPPGKLRSLAEHDARAPADASDQLQLGETWLEYARSSSDKSAAKFAVRAIHWFEAAAAEATGLMQVRCEKGLQQAIDVRDAESPIGWAILKVRPALTNGKLKRTPTLGTLPTRDKAQSFEEIPERGAVLIGFNLTTGPFEQRTVVRSVQPIFATATEILPGTIHGEPAGPPIQIRPRPGYVVTGVGIKRGKRIEELGVQYTRLKKTGLDPKSAYWSRYTGGPSLQRIEAITSLGKPIVGLIGHDGTDIYTLGFVTAP